MENKNQLKKGDSLPKEYKNVLIHKGDHHEKPQTQIPKGEYIAEFHFSNDRISRINHASGFPIEWKNEPQKLLKLCWDIDQVWARVQSEQYSTSKGREVTANLIKEFIGVELPKPLIKVPDVNNDHVTHLQKENERLKNVYNALDKAHLTASEQIQTLRTQLLSKDSEIAELREALTYCHKRMAEAYSKLNESILKQDPK